MRIWKLSRPNLTLCEELKMADKLDDVEGGGNHSYHLEDPLMTIFFPTSSRRPMPRTEVLRGKPQTEVKQGFSLHMVSVKSH